MEWRGNESDESQVGKEAPTKRGTHHDIRARELRAAEKGAVVRGGGELGFDKVELGFEVRAEVGGVDGGGEEGGEGAEEEGGVGFDGWSC